MNDEPNFYSQDLDPENVADLTLDLAVTLSPSLMAGTHHLQAAPLIGIVSERDGGIIAYAIGDENADQIVAALNAKEPA